MLLALAALLAAPAHAGATVFAAGDSAANIALDGAQKRVLLRWVAPRDGVVTRIWMHIKTEGSRCRAGRAGYAAGSGGRWSLTTYAVTAGGQPDLQRPLASA